MTNEQPTISKVSPSPTDSAADAFHKATNPDQTEDPVC